MASLPDDPSSIHLSKSEILLFQGDYCKKEYSHKLPPSNPYLLVPSYQLEPPWEMIVSEGSYYSNNPNNPTYLISVNKDNLV